MQETIRDFHIYWWPSEKSGPVCEDKPMSSVEENGYRKSSQAWISQQSNLLLQSGDPQKELLQKKSLLSMHKDETVEAMGTQSLTLLILTNSVVTPLDCRSSLEDQVNATYRTGRW